MTKGIELRQLRYFVAVAETLHFGRAAQNLGMSQPPLSRQIKDLEQELGVQLFERDRHAVQLTETGRIFLGETRKTLEQASYSFEIAQRAYRGELGQLVIGVAPMLEVIAYPALQSHLKKTYPNLRIKRHVLESTEQVSMVRDGSLDAGLVRLPLEEQDFLTVDFLFREPLVVVMRHDHPLANRRSLRISELSGQPQITLRKKFNAAFHGYIDALCHRGGYLERRTRSANSIHEMLNATIAGNGIAIVPISFRKQLTNELHYVRIRDKNADIQVGLIYRRNSSLPKVRLLQRCSHQMQWPDIG